MAAGDKIRWEDADFKWEKAPTTGTPPYTWDDVKVLEEISRSGGLDVQVLQQLEEKKKKRLVHLVMRRNGIKMYDEMKEVKDITAHAKDIEILIKEVKSNVQIIH